MFKGIRITIRIPFILIAAIAGAIAGFKFGDMCYAERRDFKEKAITSFYHNVRNPASQLVSKVYLPAAAYVDDLRERWHDFLDA